jgi:sulfoacetaldehyde acetyltransferase
MSDHSLSEMPDVLASGPQKMTPSEAFVETMAANGVIDIFGIMSPAFVDAMDISAPAVMCLIPVVHEQGADHVADGYASVRGRHGVMIGQNDPGISNCVSTIAATKKLIRPLQEIAGRLRLIAPTFLDPLVHSVPRQLAVERS